MTGKLYIVATPIGNLGDISERAIQTLKDVDKIYAEDTRVTKKLLMHFKISTPIDSYHQHSSEEKKLKILNELINGKSIAQVSDAGTPSISDPGNELIDFIYANSNGIQVIPIPGPSALTAALSVCGFNVSKFVFIGFWPRKRAKKTIQMIQNTKLPLCFYESPTRIKKTLQTLSDAFGDDMRVFIGRELTKKFETHYRGSLKEVIQQIDNEKSLKGEIVVVVGVI